MGVIVTDAGFGEDELAAAEQAGEYVALSLDDLRAADGKSLPEKLGLTLDNDTDPEAVAPYFDRISIILIPFPSFADGRGFSIARHLRDLGYRGRLRATGHLIADQYAHARRVGFDEVAISRDLAARQPEAQWLARAGWQNHFYQKRLLGAR